MIGQMPIAVAVLVLGFVALISGMVATANFRFRLWFYGVMWLSLFLFTVAATIVFLARGGTAEVTVIAWPVAGLFLLLSKICGYGCIVNDAAHSPPESKTPPQRDDGKSAL
jgi:hypothetical protein